MDSNIIFPTPSSERPKSVSSESLKRKQTDHSKHNENELDGIVEEISHEIFNFEPAEGEEGQKKQKVIKAKPIEEENEKYTIESLVNEAFSELDFSSSSPTPSSTPVSGLISTPSSSSSASPSPSLLSDIQLNENEEEQELNIQCEMILNRYKGLSESELNNKIGIDLNMLRKVIYTALTTPLENGQAMIFLPHGTFFVQRDNHNRLSTLYDFTNLRDLGKGSFGTAQVIRDLLSDKDLAVKFAREDFDHKPLGDREQIQRASEQQIRRGFLILRLLNAAQDGPIEGIPNKPHVFIDLHGKRGFSMEKGIMPLDLLTPLNNPFGNAINFESIFKNLAAGVNFLYSVGFIHNDIKLSNILLYEENGQIVAKHSDLDGGLFLDELNAKRYRGSYTLFPEQDRKQIKALLKEKGEPKNAMDLHMKQMVYCLGKAMQELANKWNIESDKFAILSRMTNENPNVRISIGEVVDHLQ